MLLSRELSCALVECGDLTVRGGVLHLKTLQGLEPVHVGALPPQCAMLTNLSAQIEEMAVEAALTGNPRLVYQAIAYDPLTAAVLSLDEINAQHIRQALETAGGKINGPGGAAQILGLNPNTLRSRMNKLGIPYGRKYHK